MKAATLAIPILLCIMLIIVPFMEFLGIVTNTEFNLYNEIATVTVQTVLCVSAVTALFIIRPWYGKVGRAFVILLLPLSVANGLCFVNPAWGWSALFVLIICGCSLAIYIRFSSDSVGKAVSAVVSVLAAIALVVLYIYNLVYNSFFSDITVIRSIESPDERYVAEVVSDASILGDKTRVTIRRSEQCFGALIGGFSDKSQLVYTGEDYEIDTVKIIWTNEKTVSVNGTDYEVLFD